MTEMSRVGLGPPAGAVSFTELTPGRIAFTPNPATAAVSDHRSVPKRFESWKPFSSAGHADVSICGVSFRAKLASHGFAKDPPPSACLEIATSHVQPSGHRFVALCPPKAHDLSSWIGLSCPPGLQISSVRTFAAVTITW